MSKLEDLVPPLKLCRKIPDGCFADSALVWNCRYGTKKGDRIVNLIERGNYDGGGLICPAPTLQKMLNELARMELCPMLEAILPIEVIQEIKWRMENAKTN